MLDRVLMYDTIMQGYWVDNYKRTPELCEASLVNIEMAKDWQKNKPEINIIELEEAFTSLQLQVRINK